jgi:hypothetical protein
VFWTEQTFPDGVKVLFENTNTAQNEHYSNPSERGIQWSPDGINVSTRGEGEAGVVAVICKITLPVHEYGGGSFYVSDSAPNVYISHNGAVYELLGPLQSPPRPVTQYPSGKDIRHADLFAHGKFIFAVQERHAQEEAGTEPQNLLVRVDAESGEVAAIAEGADFYAEPRASLDGKLLAWIQWNKPYMVRWVHRIHRIHPLTSITPNFFH